MTIWPDPGLGTFKRLDVLKVLVTSLDAKWDFGPFKSGPTFLQCLLYRQQFLVVYAKIALSRVKTLRKEMTGTQLVGWQSLPLCSIRIDVVVNQS